jgi:hypothetical protein
MNSLLATIESLPIKLHPPRWESLHKNLPKVFSSVADLPTIAVRPAEEKIAHDFYQEISRYGC